MSALRDLRTPLSAALLIVVLGAGYWLLAVLGVFGETPEPTADVTAGPAEGRGAPTSSADQGYAIAPDSSAPRPPTGGYDQPIEITTDPIFTDPAMRSTLGLGAAPAASRSLIIPVAGVRPQQLVDTYTDSRAQGRRHDAIDIAAPRGTPVVAVAEGTVLKLFRSDQGGITLYELDPDQRTIYYYAHLDRYAPTIVEGVRVSQGETIGFVGDTGNAGAGNFHLHFEISTTLDPKQYWGGTPGNPFPLLGGTETPGR